MSQASLMRDRRFWPLFWTQFLGAFNDNFFKNALVILVTYRAMTLLDLEIGGMVALCGGIFILPFFLFSAIAGQIADKYSKSALIPWIKVVEIGVMVFAAVGFMTNQLEMLLIVLFMMGFQSTVFGPVKYGILPQLLEDKELVGGNALVQMGTFLAILLGTIGGAQLINTSHGAVFVSVGVIGFAVLGTITSFFLKKIPADNPDLKVRWNPLTTTWSIINHTREVHSVFLSALGVAWFWFYGASLLSLFPIYCEDILRGNESVTTLFLSLFSIGIMAGSLLCGKLSRERTELGLVPVGSLGLTLFAFDLFLVGIPAVTGLAEGELMGVKGLLSQAYGWRIVADLFLISLFGGFYIVPLYTMVQQRSEPKHRARVIAGANILNAFLMVLSSIFLIVLHTMEVSVPVIFLLLSVLNLLVAAYIYTVIPEFLYRFVCYIIANCLYRLRVKGTENIPEEGPAVLVCNHTSFVDWLIISAICKRPLRFVMHYKFMKLPLVGHFFRRAQVIPIAPRKHDPDVMDKAFDIIAEVLKSGEMVCIFPEGVVTHDGEIGPFRSGIERIIARTPVPVIPMAFRGMWGSLFTRKTAKGYFGKLWSKIEFVIDKPWRPETVTAEGLREKVLELRGEAR